MSDDFQHERRWYERRMCRRGTYRHFAAAIHEAFEPRSLLDVGCGVGWIVEWMLEHGVPAFGEEGSEAAFSLMPETVRPRVERCDLRGAVPPAFCFYDLDFCVSIEVAEHIEPQHVGHFLDWITRGQSLLLTAAPPGQGGHHHVNEQPREYWIGLLDLRGWRYDAGQTEEWKRAVRDRTDGCPWVARNAMFLERSHGV